LRTPSASQEQDMGGIPGAAPTHFAARRAPRAARPKPKREARATRVRRRCPYVCMYVVCKSLSSVLERTASLSQRGAYAYA